MLLQEKRLYKINLNSCYLNLVHQFRAQERYGFLSEEMLVFFLIKENLHLDSDAFSNSEFHSLKCSVSAIMMRRLLTLGFGCIGQVFLGFNASNLIGYRHV